MSNPIWWCAVAALGVGVFLAVDGARIVCNRKRHSHFKKDAWQSVFLGVLVIIATTLYLLLGGKA